MDAVAAELARPAHHLHLERLAAKALAAEDFADALKFADRRCRIAPPPQAHCFVLRAEAAWRLGQHADALADLETAIAIAPDDLGANRRLLSWTDGERRRRAATELLAHDTSPANLRAAIAVLQLGGDDHWAAVQVFETELVGWIAWRGEATFEATLSTEGAALTSAIEADPFHPLATSAVQAAALHLRRPLSSAVQILTLRRDGKTFRTLRLAPNQATPPALRRKPDIAPDSKPRVRVQARPQTKPAVPPTVIVPVYGDAEATMACLDSLGQAAAAAQRDAAPFRIVVVDDASPEPALKGHLQALAALQEIELLVNPVNLGFIGAVNRALDHVTEGDVVLLNADTIVAPGFVARLAAAAHSAPDIGTVTPLSNNGEFFSFPTPNSVNPMPEDAAITALDRAAADANAGTVVDMPSGIGFCLYIRRDCLTRIGGLSDSFERGYLEDVDFCLRARAGGFRSVCAPAVYVGHHGSRSFQDAKRALVLRNLDVLDRRFPHYRGECRAIESADPLRPARAALEAALPPAHAAPVLIAAGRGAAHELARARADQLARDDRPAILLIPEGRHIRLAAADGGRPQSLLLRFDSGDATAAAEAELRRLQASHLELVDPATPQALIDLIRRLGLSIERWITSAGMLDGIEAGDPLLAPTELAARFARARLGEQAETLQITPWPVTPPALPAPARGRPKALVVVPATASARAFQAIRALLRHTGRLRQRTPVVVLGESFADRRLMSSPDLFVTGPIEACDIARVLAAHNPGFILTGFESPLFGHPLVEAMRAAPLPVATRDWSDGTMEVRGGDLAVAASSDDEALATAVARWINGDL